MAQWLYKIASLVTPALIKKEQHERLRLAITELQEKAITQVLNEDKNVDVVQKENTVKINLIATEDVANETVITFVTNIRWEDPKLLYTPVRMAINGGRITGITTLADVTIDTAEDC